MGAAAGVTGPTGPTGLDGCCVIGIKVVDISDPDPDGNIVLTPADLLNVTHVGARYETLRITGAIDEPLSPPRIILPAPASLNDSYTIRFENVSDNVVTPAIDATLLATFNLPQFLGAEASLEQEIVDGAASSASYRMDVIVTPEGAFRLPGFTIAGGG